MIVVQYVCMWRMFLLLKNLLGMFMCVDKQQCKTRGPYYQMIQYTCATWPENFKDFYFLKC